MVAAFSQGWPKGCEGGCAARGAQGRPSELGPCTPGACVLGQGLCHLPGSALSLPGELPTALRGEAVGGRNDHRQDNAGHGRAGQGRAGQGRVRLLLGGCCVGQVCSQLHITTRKLPRGCFKGKVKAGVTVERRGFLHSSVLLLLLSCSCCQAPWGWEFQLQSHTLILWVLSRIGAWE